MQNSKKIKFQWLSNEDPPVPAKGDPGDDIFSHDFYGNTDFEIILTSAKVEKTLGKSKVH